jgi:hypothetical protein
LYIVFVKSSYKKRCFDNPHILIGYWRKVHIHPPRATTSTRFARISPNPPASTTASGLLLLSFDIQGYITACLARSNVCIGKQYSTNTNTRRLPPPRLMTDK